MSKIVFLQLGQGDLQNGFPGVEMRLEDGGSLIAQKSGYLPVAANLAHCFMEWQFLYEAFYDQQRYRLRGTNTQALEAAQADLDELEEIEFETTGITGFSEQDCRTIAATVSAEMQIWLNAPGLLEINNVLRTWLQVDEAIRVIIETHDPRLQQLPWHCWQFFADYRHAEPSFSAPEFEQRRGRSQRRRPRILAVLGNRDGIDSTAEEAFLQRLKAEAIFLVEPSLQVLTEALRHPKGWDIFFFAGHSSSQTGGQFFLNATETVTIDDLRYALQKAISEGLKLAIFNSCDGSKLAQALQGLNLPTVIVMKEPVPNQVAQDFLRSFLQSFAAGASLPTAVREARESLQGSEREFPCASWLPGIWQNPAAPSPLWHAPLWHDFEALLRPHPPQRLRWQTVLAMSLVVTGLVMGARSLGAFRGLELKAFDHLMQLRPIERTDSRLVIIKITDADEQEQNRQKDLGSGSLRDRTLQNLITILDKYQPRVIGIDIYRDQPIAPRYVPLQSRLQSNQSLPIVGICQHPNPQNNPPTPGISKPPDIPVERIGFSDLSYDSDRVIRRQLLKLDLPVSLCESSTSFALQLALHYLKADHITPKYSPSKGYLELSNVIFKRLESHVGGYQNSSFVNADINQILLNYRPYQNLDQISTSMTLQQVLSEQFNPNFIKDRIVLIGRTDKDFHVTPYNAEHADIETPGVYLHAQAVSQILAAVLDKRGLINWLPIWGDFLWVCFWAGAGGILAEATIRLRHNSQRLQTVGLITGLVLLYLWCRVFTVWIIVWFPLIPALIAFMATHWATIALNQLHLQQQRQSTNEPDSISHPTHE